MVMDISKLRGKKIITTGGRILGDVKEVVIDVDANEISHLLTIKLEDLAKTDKVREAIAKNSILYQKRFKGMGETVVVSDS